MSYSEYVGINGDQVLYFFWFRWNHVSFKYNEGQVGPFGVKWGSSLNLGSTDSPLKGSTFLFDLIFYGSFGDLKQSFVFNTKHFSFAKRKKFLINVLIFVSMCSK